ncbi:MAG: hypothetical protein K2Y16_04940 [Burkholderiales bacterium]|nr:hypothetical protein [Burkholderiales bacterium]MBY0577192.1 hypothetical protein [Gallionellaceae bacterium]
MPEILTSPVTAGAKNVQYGPWNPGISSQLPSQLLTLSTIFRPENVFTSFAHARELRDFTGLALEELVIFRPERLVVHELLIRITSDFSVPDGPRVEDLGINFRRMTDTIFNKHVKPRMPEITGEYARIKRTLSEFIDAELSATLCAPATGAETGAEEKTRGKHLLALARLLRKKTDARPRAEDEGEREERVLREWTAKAHSDGDPLQKAAYRSLARIVSAIRIKHGRVPVNKALLASLAVGIACNEYGSETLGHLIQPHVRKAAAEEGYRLLPTQEQPVVMNTKGASASGKSTMRPLQRKLAEKIGANWSDFAVISPDIWRKYLLDYGSLGDAYKYAGAFAGLELGIIDRKLDLYMARKAERGEMSHLLIDRFRFDSFAPDSHEEGSNLLTRFGHFVYMFFMITPPHATVERAWQRGLEVGRYKAVDDLLAHNVEAYTGMPELFFTWAIRTNKSVHYEFLDNSVPAGEQPRTVAFGWNGELNILDVKCMLDVDRYRKINVDATSPEQVYPDRQTLAAENNVQFLSQCARRMPTINFVDRATGHICARMESGRLVWVDPETLGRAMEDPETRAGILAVAPAALEETRRSGAGSRQLHEALQAARFHTLGQW